MIDAIQLHSHVGDDGVLKLQVDLGQSEAKSEVVVTIEPADAREGEDSASLSWTDFLAQTYGSCAGLDLQRQDQGTFEEREPIP